MSMVKVLWAADEVSISAMQVLRPGIALDAPLSVIGAPTSAAASGYGAIADGMCDRGAKVVAERV